MPRLSQSEQAEKAALISEYKKAAQQADKRLYRLTQYAKNPKYENVLKWSYAKAEKEIRKWGGEKKTRFGLSEKKLQGLSRTQLQARLNDINQFLESKSSTLVGIKETYANKAKAFNKEFGTHFTWEQFAEYQQSGLAEKLDQSYGYRTSQTAIGYIQKNKQKIMDYMNNQKAGSIKIVDDAVVNKRIADILNEYGLEGLKGIL